MLNAMKYGLLVVLLTILCCTCTRPGSSFDDDDLFLPPALREDLPVRLLFVESVGLPESPVEGGPFQFSVVYSSFQDPRALQGLSTRGYDNYGPFYFLFDNSLRECTVRPWVIELFPEGPIQTTVNYVHEAHDFYPLTAGQWKLRIMTAASREHGGIRSIIPRGSSRDSMPEPTGHETWLEYDFTVAPAN